LAVAERRDNQVQEQALAANVLGVLRSEGWGAESARAAAGRALLDRAKIADVDELLARVDRLTWTERKELRDCLGVDSVAELANRRRRKVRTLEKHLENGRRKLGSRTTVEAGLLLVLAEDLQRRSGVGSGGGGRLTDSTDCLSGLLVTPSNGR